MQSNGAQNEWREAKVQEETLWPLIESVLHLSVWVESHGTSDSRQPTSVGSALTISGQVGIVTETIQTVLVQNSQLKYCLCGCDEENAKFVVTYQS